MRELKSQLAYSRNIGFFLGAGTSCALGLPNIAQLTQQIEAILTGASLKIFTTIRDDLQAKLTDGIVSIEDIWNQIRRIREITGERNDSSYIGIDGESAKNLDIEICKKTYNILAEKEAAAVLDTPKNSSHG